jgi:catechol 2,3-dioxygenase-like lactoylglutathione lyase family enzyme
MEHDGLWVVSLGLCRMYLSHIDVTMPCGGEELARSFYGGYLGLRELIRPESSHGHGEIWFDAGGLQLHLSLENERAGADSQRHFGLGCGDLEGLKSRLKVAGWIVEDGPPTPWKRFFTYDPFGNRIEIHQPCALRG